MWNINNKFNNPKRKLINKNKVLNIHKFNNKNI